MAELHARALIAEIVVLILAILAGTTVLISYRMVEVCLFYS